MKFLMGVLLEPTRDTTSLTNIGFAILIALSSIFFAWARSLDDKKYIWEIRALNRLAAISILGGIIFIFASLFKYLIRNPNDEKLWYIEKSTQFDIYFLYAGLILCVIALLIVIVFVVAQSFLIFGALWKDLYTIIVDPTVKPREDRRTEI